MQLLPCQLQPEQASALCNTFPNVYPARPIMTGRMAIETLILPFRNPVPLGETFDPVHCVVSYTEQRGGRRHPVEIVCPLGVPGTQLWIREEMAIVDVLGDGSAVRAIYTMDRQGRVIHLDETDDKYHTGQLLMTPKPEWSRPDRLFVREVTRRRLKDLTEEDAMRMGAPPTPPANGSTLPCKTHLSGLRMWWGNWHGLTDWAEHPALMCWLVSFERTFKEDGP